ncbi:MAG TPA: OmpH family outer membrane protein [Candidatus Binatia bacterium]
MYKLLAVVFLLFAAPAWGQQVKIGLIDIQRAINESQPGKTAKERLQAQVKKAEADMNRERQDIEKGKADFDKKGPLLKEDDRRKMEGELQKRIVNYQRNSRDVQEELGLRQREAEAAILKDLEGVVAEIGKNEKFTFILEKSQLLYSDQAIDITTKVIELYNGRSSGAAKAVKGK